MKKDTKKDTEQCTLHSVMPSFDSPKNWTEDYENENGNYINKCTKCEEHFFGHKRRFICKECFKMPY